MDRARPRRSAGTLPRRREPRRRSAACRRQSPCRAARARTAAPWKRGAAGEGDLALFPHGLADHGERLLGELAVGGQEVGGVPVEPVDLGLGHKALDLDRARTLDLNRACSSKWAAPKRPPHGRKMVPDPACSAELVAGELGTPVNLHWAHMRVGGSASGRTASASKAYRALSGARAQPSGKLSA
jgi:hypothetical protein